MATNIGLMMAVKEGIAEGSCKGACSSRPVHAGMLGAIQPRLLSCA